MVTVLMIVLGAPQVPAAAAPQMTETVPLLLATQIVSLFGSQATPSGPVLPAGRLMVALTVLVASLITDTVEVPSLATYTECVTGSSARNTSVRWRRSAGSRASLTSSRPSPSRSL
jgi:hypothetical protein